MVRVAAGLTVALILALTAGGCSVGYFAHLGKGAWSLATKGRSIDKLIESAETVPELKARLLVADGLLEFADRELGLSRRGKYQRYVALQRPYVTWTVVAAPQFSLVPETWCFPVAGCVAYRGFFTRQKAERFARGLSSRGLEVSIGGVRAFSSLGWLRDPLLDTFLFSGDRELAALLFHELAHGVVYVRDDSAFNESFAAAVERAGVRRWLRATAGGTESSLADYRLYLERTDQAYRVIERARARLEELYSGTAASRDEPARRSAKAGVLRSLGRELEVLAASGEFAFVGWARRDLNNADLASIGLYHRWVAAFEDLLAAVGDDLESFYASARHLGELDAEVRARRLGERDWDAVILSRSAERAEE